MSRTTPGTLVLERLGIAFQLHPYDYDPEAPRIGLDAAEALGLDPAQVFKTLMAEVDGKPVCVVVPSNAEVTMKKLATCFGGKSAAMMKPPTRNGSPATRSAASAPSDKSARSRRRWTKRRNSSRSSTSMPGSVDCC